MNSFFTIKQQLAFEIFNSLLAGGEPVVSDVQTRVLILKSLTLADDFLRISEVFPKPEPEGRPGRG